MKISVKLTRQQLAEKISNKVNDFYYMGSDSIPSIENSTSFASFVGRASQLGMRLNRHIGEYRFTIEKSGSAYISWMPSKKIVLPLWYFSKKALAEYFEGVEDVDYEAVAISLANGSHIHEALHSVFTVPLTSPTQEIFGEYYEAKDDTRKMVAREAAQIFEDVWNESAISSIADETSFEFVKLKNSILFDFGGIQPLLDEYASICDLGSLSSQVKLQKRMNFLTYMKSLNSLYAEEFERNIEAIETAGDGNLGKILRWAIDFSEAARFSGLNWFGSSETFFSISETSKLFRARQDVVTRNKLTTAFTKLIEILLEDIKVEEVSFVSNTGDAGGKGEGSEKDKQSEEIAEGEFTSAEMNAIASSFSENAKQETSTKPSEMVKTSTLGFMVNSRSAVFYKNFNEYVKCEGVSLSSDELGNSETDWSSINQLRQLATENHTTGELFKSGPHLVPQKLAQLKTTGKVFSNKTNVTHTKNEIEFVLNIDLSGSVGTSFGRLILTEAYSFYQMALKAGYKCDVYAHTGRAVDQGTPMVVKLCSGGVNGPIDSNAKQKITNGLSIKQNQNYDGHSILVLKEKAFNSRSTAKKIIINLSDGSPCGDNYNGSEADNHTKQAIAILRKAGIGVFAISLVKSVVDDNTSIYGEDYNIDGSDGRLKVEFKKLLYKMQGGDANKKSLRTA